MRRSRAINVAAVFCGAGLLAAQQPYAPPTPDGQTIALWLFDEPQTLYPSASIDDTSWHDYVMALGLGGRIVAGKFGNALDAIPYPPIQFPAGDAKFGLSPAPPEPDQ